MKAEKLKGKLLYAVSAGVLAMTLGSFAAHAQDQAEPTNPDESLRQKVVTVTAQRREQDIQNVPISVAAMNQDDLDTLGINSTNSLELATPGIVNTQTAGDGISAIYIRGVGTGYSGPGLEGSVAFYFDDIYMQTQTSSAQAAVDLAQIEILKGPQGTLYGRNATGGAVLISTQNPKLETSEGYAKFGLGDLDWRRTEGVLNIPMGDKFAIRAAGFWEKRDGYVNNIAFPSEQESGTGAGETYSARIKALWQPTPDFSLLGTASFDRRNGNGAIHSLRFNGDGSPTGLGFYETMQSRVREGGGGDDTDATLYALRGEYTMGDWTFTNTTAYRRTRAYGCTDNDGLPEELLYFCTVSHLSPNNGGADGKEDETFTNEFRVVSDTGGRFDVTAGVFYEENDARFSGRIGGAWFNGTPTFDNKDKLEALSAYVELYTQLTDKIQLITGLRYTTEDKEHYIYDDDDTVALYGGTIPNDQGTAKTDFSNTSPRIVISYDAGLVNYYASYNQGFKSGGFNSPSLTQDPPLDPETIDAFEVGAKYRSADGSLGIDGALYYYDWEDVQVAFITGGGSGILQQNAAAAENKGAEINIDYAPNDDWRFNTGIAYTNARFTDFPNAAVYNLIGGFLTATAADLSGDQVPHAPDWTINASITHRFDIAGDWSGDVTLAGHYTSEYDFTAGGGGELHASAQDALTLINLTGNIYTPNDNITLGWFINNLTDEESYSLVSTGNTGVYMTPSEPQLWGVTAKFAFQS